jgi:hypothetical protein
MTRFRRFLPSPAMAVALLALFMAMGGSAYALVITSGSIKNNTIRSADVRNHALLGKDMRSNGVGGGAIKESTLGTVPSAFIAHGSARYAVVTAGGQGVRGRGTASVARTAEGRHDRRPHGRGAARQRPDHRERSGLERERGGHPDYGSTGERREQAVPPSRALLGRVVWG